MPERRQSQNLEDFLDEEESNNGDSEEYDLFERSNLEKGDLVMTTVYIDEVTVEDDSVGIVIGCDARESTPKYFKVDFGDDGVLVKPEEMRKLNPSRQIRERVIRDLRNEELVNSIRAKKGKVSRNSSNVWVED